MIVLAGLVVFGTASPSAIPSSARTTITAYFPTATSIYPGDDVRVSGMKVGTIDSIQPEGTRAKIVEGRSRRLHSRGRKAVIVAQNLMAARYVQLTPAYRSSGPTMRDGAMIPLERTAVPVEWDQVKSQLMRLATELGPNSDVSTPSVWRFIDSAADALGAAMVRNSGRHCLSCPEWHGSSPTAAADSSTPSRICRCSSRPCGTATPRSCSSTTGWPRLTSVLDDNKSDLDAALTDLSGAVGEVQRFIAGSRDATSEQLQRLAEVTQILVDNKMALKNVLHVAPNAVANGYNDYDPDVGNIRGGVGLQNFTNPTYALCSQIGALENATSVESGKLCGLYLSPALKVFNPLVLFNFNFLPIPLNPFLAPAFDPKNVVYTEDRLKPGGIGPRPIPPELPPAVSAYTGLPGDVPNPQPASVPLGRIPGAAMPEPPPPSVPVEPPPAPANVQDMLLPPGGQQP